MPPVTFIKWVIPWLNIRQLISDESLYEPVIFCFIATYWFSFLFLATWILKLEKRPHCLKGVKSFARDLNKGHFLAQPRQWL